MTDRPELSLNALAHEALAKPFRFEYGPRWYRLPGSPDLRAAGLLAEGRLFEALEALLGDDPLDEDELEGLEPGTTQWEAFSDEPLPFTEPMLEQLFDAYGTHAGIDMGESRASSVSSNRKARRSRPTSAGSTRPTSRTSRRAS